MVSQEQRRVIEKYLSLREDDLLLAIFDYASDEETFEFSAEGQRAAGLRIFNRLRGRLYEIVCVEWNYCRRRHDPDLQDTIALVAAVSDIIVSACGMIPSVLISVLLVKKGLNNFCGCE